MVRLGSWGADGRSGPGGADESCLDGPSRCRWSGLASGSWLAVPMVRCGLVSWEGGCEEW